MWRGVSTYFCWNCWSHANESCRTKSVSCFSRVRKPVCLLSAMLASALHGTFLFLNTWEDLNTQHCELVSNFPESDLSALTTGLLGC